MLVGCAAQPAARPRYGLAPSAAAPTAENLASVGGADAPPAASVAADAPVASGNPAEIPGSGGTLVPGREGVAFVPGQSPAEVDAQNSPTLAQRWKRNWQRLTGSTPSQPKAQQLFADGERLFAAKEYSAAARRYKRAAKLWPDSELEENALFMRAESLFFADHYPGSSDAYARLLKEFENSRFLDTAVRRQFAMARYWEELQRKNPKYVISPNFFDRTRPMFDTMGNAIAAYDSVRLNDPTGPLADDSIMATANVYFVDERYSDADHYYDILRKDYPKSDYQMPAHILGYQAKLRMYQGPLYDQSPLVQARDLGRNTLLQFGDQLGEERARIETSQRWVGDQLAARGWNMAQFYENTAHYGAASRYYQVVVDEHAESQYAELARQRIGDIADEPAVPAEKLTWLANLFPGEKAKSEARLANNRPRARPVENVANEPPSERVLR